MAAEPNLSAHIFKRVEISRLDAFYALQYFARRKIPPFQREKRGDIFVRKSLTDWLCGHAAHNRAWRNILCHDGTRADNCAVAYRNSCKNDRFKAYPHVVADYDISLIVPGFVCPNSMLLFVIENRKRICRQRAHCMIGAVEQKLSAARNRTELAYFELVAIYGIVI